MVAARCRNKPFLQNLEMRHWARFADYVLGEKCYTLKVPQGASGKAAVNPPWQIVLQYEHEMRKWAIREAHQAARSWGKN